MDRLRIGRSMRAIRVRLGWRQADVAVAAAVSRSFISNIELGLARHSDISKLELVCQALGADLDVRVRWRGEGLDRLLDEAHAVLVDRVVAELRAASWEVAVEVTFNEFGDRGSVDVLGWHVAAGALLVVEVKSVVPDAQATLLPLDRKARLGSKIGRSRGWEARAVSRLLVLAGQTANRRRIARLAATFDVVLPTRGHAVRRWLRAPAAPMAGLLFVPDSPPDGVRRTTAGRQRVNRPRNHAMGGG
jgi:transcriptional regulator with XRE-family HTH domain